MATPMTSGVAPVRAINQSHSSSSPGPPCATARSPKHSPHLHRAIDRRFAGTVAGTAPSTAHQVLLDLEPQAPLQFVFEPPGYQLHVWREGTGLVSHTAMFWRLAGP